RNARDVAVPTRPIARRDRIRLITGVLSLGLSRADLSITHASTGVVPVTRSRRPTAGGQDERPRSRDKRSGPLLQKGFAVGEAFSRCGGRMGGADPREIRSSPVSAVTHVWVSVRPGIC